MTRRERYKQCLFWRGFIAQASSISDEEELRNFIFSVSEVQTIQIEHGWTTWVTVILKDGKEFSESERRPIDSLKLIAQRIYRHAVNEYIEYQNLLSFNSLKW